MNAVEVQLDFVKDSSGAVTLLVSHQGGRDTIARRISEGKGELPPKQEFEWRRWKSASARSRDFICPVARTRPNIVLVHAQPFYA